MNIKLEISKLSLQKDDLVIFSLNEDIDDYEYHKLVDYIHELSKELNITNKIIILTQELEISKMPKDDLKRILERM